MANFFSLNSGNTAENPDNINNNYTSSWVCQKGFEIWQQYVQVNHQHSPYHVGPTGSSGTRSSSSSRSVMRGSIGGGGGGGGINCQDCGNQAKKDCGHLRCRACCKSRGFECPTHVRSTWVPAAKRRERQQQRSVVVAAAPFSKSEMMSNIHQKRQRESVNCLGRGSTSEGLELGHHFPNELSSSAVFRCVRVHSADDADDQLAYQTAVNIGGRLFKGILYDQGPNNPPGGGGGGAETVNLINKQPENADVATLLDANAMYSPPISAFLAGTQFFHAPRS